MGRHTSLQARIREFLADGYCERRQIALRFGVTVGVLDHAIRPMLDSGEVIQGEAESRMGPARITFALARAVGEPGTVERRPRRCLSCGATFESAWAMNRLCPRCSGSARTTSSAGAFDRTHSVRYR